MRPAFLFLIIVGASTAQTRTASAPGWRAEVDALKAKGDAAGALARLEQVEQNAKPSAAIEDEMGFLLAVLNRRADAMDRFRKALAIDSKFAAAHYHLGVALWLEGNRGAALPARTGRPSRSESVRLSLSLRHALVDLSNTAGPGHTADAVAECKAATSLRAGSAAAWNQLGLALQHQGDRKAAVDAYAKAVDIEPANADFRNNYGLMLLETGVPERAITQFQTLLARDPGNLSALGNIGLTYLYQGNLIKANEQFEKVLQLDPASAIVHYNLGLAYKQKDDLTNAKLHLRRATELDPRIAEAHFTLGVVHRQDGEFADVISEMRAAIAVNPNYAEAYYLLGTAFKQSGQRGEAIAALKEAIRLNPNTPGPFTLLGQILRASGDAEGSRQAFAEAGRIKKQKESEQKTMFDRAVMETVGPAAGMRMDRKP